MTDATLPTPDPTKTWDSKVFKYERQLNCCRFSPCGKFLFAGAYDGSVLRWELETDAQTQIQGHDGWLEDLVFSPDGKLVFTVDTWGRLSAWNYADEMPKPVWTVPQAHASWIRDVQVSPDGKLLATCGNDMVVRLWTTTDGKLSDELKGHQRHVYSLAFHSDGKALVSGDLLGVVKHWNVADGKFVRELDASMLFNHPEDRIIDAGGVRSMTFSSDGKTLICGGISELRGSTVAGKPCALQFDWTTGKLERELRPKDFKKVYEVKGIIVEGLRFHQEGFLVAVGGNGERQGAMWFWKLDGQDPFHEINEIPGGRDVDIHPDGMRLAVAQFEPNGRGINGGNGRKTKPDEYHSHDGAVRIYTMSEKPPEKKEAAKKKK